VRRFHYTLTILLLAGCQPTADAIEDDEGWQANSAEERVRLPYAACPNGGNYEPDTPGFASATVDGYAKYDGQDTCAPTARPGVEAFRDFVLKTYPCTTNGGITRECSIGGTSEHKEGRAWDWMVKYPHPAADALLGWLLATDANGQQHAIARRVGIMYMIWNKKIWKAYQAGSGWQSYSGSNPHTDHVHFSFSWDGANKKTSFWDVAPTPPPPTPPPPTPPPPSPPPPPAPAPDQPPKGQLDGASCEGGLAGWAQDPDQPSAALEVELYVDRTPDAAGSPPLRVTASTYRADLCLALGSCEHGFAITIPSSLLDGAPHAVRAYALDAAGKRTLLGGSPRSFTCAAPASPPAPTTPPPAIDPTPPAGGPAPVEPPDTSEPPPTEAAPYPQQLTGGCALVGEPPATPAATLLVLALALLARRRRR
jgi:uncharacterized protein (TIGR03382 family)